MEPLNETDLKTTEPLALDVSKKLARSIGLSSHFQLYEKAIEKLRNDQKTQDLLNEFQSAQQNLQMLQSWGGASQKDIEQFEQLKKQLFSNPILKEYFGSQEKLVLMLKELNAFISEKLGFDFADLTKPAGGCC